MSDLPASGAAAMHTLQRHREILQGYRQEFNKICANHTMRIEREELLRGSGLATSSGSPSISGLSRREMYLKESGHLSSASHLVNDQINIAIETRDHLHAQRQAFKRLQTRFNDISNRFPLISRWGKAYILDILRVKYYLFIRLFFPYSSTLFYLYLSNESTFNNLN